MGRWMPPTLVRSMRLSRPWKMVMSSPAGSTYTLSGRTSISFSASSTGMSVWRARISGRMVLCLGDRCWMST